jgi:hypothetical protein
MHSPSFASRASLVSGVLLVAFAACGRTSNSDDGVKDMPVGGAAAEPTAVGGSPISGSSTSSAGLQIVLGGDTGQLAPGPFDCIESDRPGEPCSRSLCRGQSCGTPFELACVDGVWTIAGSAAAFEKPCPPGNEHATNIADIVSGACCGAQVPRNDDTASCNLCPEGEPRDGDPCELPADCSPAVIDCFYRCCCYGHTTWAQCDGERWRVETDCSSK